MYKILILAVRTLFVLMLLSVSSASYAQFDEARIRIEIDQLSDEFGDKSYGVSARTLFAGSSVVVSPNGSRFTGRSPVSALTFEEVEGEIFGLWTVEDTGRFGTEELEIHNFTIEPFGMDSVFSESPFVVSPSDGDTVRPGFLFDWAYADGVDEPSSRTTRSSGFQGLDPDVTFGVGSEVTIDAVFDPGVTSSPLTISAGSFAELDQLVSPVTTLVDVPRSSFFAGLLFRNVTSPITVTITSVPEPGTGMLFAACGLFMFGRRIRSY